MSSPSCIVIQYYVNYGIAVYIQWCTELDRKLSGDFYGFSSSHLNGCSHSIRRLGSGERESSSCSCAVYLLCGCSSLWLAGDVAYMIIITFTRALSQCSKVPTHRTLATTTTTLPIETIRNALKIVIILLLLISRS